MRRLVMLLGTVAALGGIAAAGYLGYRNARPPEQAAAVRPPATVPVTRGDVERTVSAPGQLVNTREVVLSLQAGGRLAELNVRPGDAVKAGQRLAALDTAALQVAARQAHADYVIAQAEYSSTVRGPGAAQLSAARADLSSAQAAYKDLQNPPGDNQVANLKAALLNAEAALRRAQAAYDRAYAFNPAGIGGAPEGMALEQATNDYNAAKANYDGAFEKPKIGDVRAALARIAGAQAGLAALTPAPETVAQVKARLDKAYLLWQQAEADAQLGTLVAPMDGVVLEVKAREGDTLHAGDGLIVLADPEAVEIKTSVIEEDLPVVREGQTVQVYFDAAPDAVVQGHVSRIVPSRLEGDRPLYPVYVSVDHLPQGLAPGMTVDSSIVIAKASSVLRLPRALVRAGAGDSAQVEVWANGQRERRTIKAGLRGDTYVEILDGLNEGEQVVGE